MKPLECVRSQRKQVRLFRDRREIISAKNLTRHGFTVPGQVQFRALGKARKIGYHEDLLALKLAHKSQYFSIRGKQYFHFSAPESRVLFALRNHALHPP